MQNFSLLSPKKILFGWGQRAQLGQLAKSLGKRAFLIDGSQTVRRSAHWEAMIRDLQTQGVHVETIASTTREPTVVDVDQVTHRVRSHGVQHGDFVIGLGGGAAIDLAKAVSAMATNVHGGSVRAFLEGIGSGATIDVPPLPMLAVPTTAGTGSEATKNAVISVDDPACKKSLRSEQMVPEIVLIDPELTVTLPPAITAASGMDAITQLIESFISRRAQPIPQALCVEGLRLALPAMKTVLSDPTDREARTAMSYAALLSGIALANSGLGMAHGVAAALGAKCSVAHGIACAVMLPAALRANKDAAATAMQSLVQRLTCHSDHTPESAYRFLEEQIEELLLLANIPKRLSDLGVQPEQIPQLVTGSRGNSMHGNPQELSDTRLTEILEEML